MLLSSSKLSNLGILVYKSTAECVFTFHTPAWFGPMNKRFENKSLQDVVDGNKAVCKPKKPATQQDEAEGKKTLAESVHSFFFL